MTTTVQAQQKNTPENKRIKKRNKKKLAGKERACCRVDAARQREAPAMQSINLYGAACGCLQCVCGGGRGGGRGVCRSPVFGPLVLITLRLPPPPTRRPFTAGHAPPLDVEPTAGQRRTQHRADRGQQRRSQPRPQISSKSPRPNRTRSAPIRAVPCRSAPIRFQLMIAQYLFPELVDTCYT